jgi:hypothetical protein
MRNRHLQKRVRTVRTLLKSLSANYRNGCPHITEKGVRELVKPADTLRFRSFKCFRRQLLQVCLRRKTCQPRSIVMGKLVPVRIARADATPTFAKSPDSRQRY